MEKFCMHCGHSYEGRDDETMDCPYCGGCGDGTWMNEDKGHEESSPVDSSSGSSSFFLFCLSEDGCAVALGILFLPLILGRVFCCIRVVIRFEGIALGCCFLIIGLVFLWNKIKSFKSRSRTKKDFGCQAVPVDASSSRTPSASMFPAGTDRTSPSDLRTEDNKTTDREPLQGLNHRNGPNQQDKE